jgi:hypothetical protein
MILKKSVSSKVLNWWWTIFYESGKVGIKSGALPSELTIFEPKHISHHEIFFITGFASQYNILK